MVADFAGSLVKIRRLILGSDILFVMNGYIPDHVLVAVFGYA